MKKGKRWESSPLLEDPWVKSSVESSVEFGSCGHCGLFSGEGTWVHGDVQ